jgi:NADPH:quinone reductase-like Zn-dependent oxidoreductase
VWSNLVLTGQASRQGETLLVHGGSSGIGTMAIQVAQRAGSPRVAVTAGSRGQARPPAADFGADILVNYREQDFVDVVRDATDWSRGVDVILDNMGAKYLPNAMSEALATGGRLVIIGMQGGSQAASSTSPPCSVNGPPSMPRPCAPARPRRRQAIVASVREHVWPMIASGRVRPIVNSTHRLADAAAAHRELEASGHVGKILLQP